ncbi:MAG: hypothetical protein DHS20C01_34450 [marine bacterium B5-7]|nr:MAG: hypothetical protein DHS20C01_34450 [marine bacterium B5-7]
MKYFRLYADHDGESHFDEIEETCTPMEYAPPAPPLDVSRPIESTRYIFVRFPADWQSDFHQTPRRQLFVVLSGEIEGDASDGARMTFGPGDVLLMEDTEGRGHTARVISQMDVSALIVHIE